MSPQTYPLHVHRYPDAEALGRAAGRHAAEVLRRALAEHGRARIMLAAAPSQAAMLASLAASDVDFTRVQCFHMDDYLGLSPAAPQGFGTWLEANFLARLGARRPEFFRIDTSGDPDASARAYADVLGDLPFNLTLCGLGVNGHLAFNDPPADLADPEPVRVVALDRVSRQQQVDEGHFPSVDAVPTQALTVTIPRLLNADHVICSVPGQAKRQAVADTVQHDPDGRYPGTALHTHPDAHLYTDRHSYPEENV